LSKVEVVQYERALPSVLPLEKKKLLLPSPRVVRDGNFFLMNTAPSAGRHRPNYVYAILSVTAVLFFLGVMGLFLLQAQRLNTVLKEQVDIIVELHPGVADSLVQQSRQRIARSGFTVPESTTFISREEALATMAEDLGEELLSLDLPNPLSDVITFNVKATYLQADSLERIRELVQRSPAVADVYYQENITSQLAANTQRMGWVLLLIGLLFLALALTVIHNTIRLALYGKRMLIKTQELVGASWEFISRPFLWQAFWIGLFSGLLAVGLLVGLQSWLQYYLPELKALHHPVAFVTLFAGLLLLGILISLLSTYVVVRKYLRLRVEELY
jgi:cell division transport system permease protein